MTQPNSNSGLILQKSPVYDVANSLLVLRVYFQFSWKGANGSLNNSMPYYLKFMKETSYSGYDTEFPRAFQRLSEIIRSNNPLKTAILYQNHNKGRFVQGVQNPEVFKIVDSKGRLNITCKPGTPDNVIEFVEANFDVLNQLYHGKV